MLHWNLIASYFPNCKWNQLKQLILCSHNTHIYIDKDQFHRELNWNLKHLYKLTKQNALRSSSFVHALNISLQKSWPIPQQPEWILIFTALVLMKISSFLQTLAWRNLVLKYTDSSMTDYIGYPRANTRHSIRIKNIKEC